MLTQNLILSVLDTDKRILKGDKKKIVITMNREAVFQTVISL